MLVMLSSENIYQKLFFLFFLTENSLVFLNLKNKEKQKPFFLLVMWSKMQEIWLSEGTVW